MNKKVSVIVPVYNRENLLYRSIESILNQEYKELEIIIVDDHSTDGSVAMIKKYMHQDKRIRLLSNSHRKGPAGARNTGILEATGDYLSFLDSDDEWLPNHISESVRVLEQKCADMCFSFWYEKDIKGDRKERFGDNPSGKRIDHMLDDLNLSKSDTDIVLSDKFLEYVILKRLYCYHINTIVVKTNMVKNRIMFHEYLGTNEDLDFTIRLFDTCKVCLIRNCHFIYYQGTDNLYQFMDRSKIDLHTILTNQELIRRMIYCDYNKAKMFQLRKGYIKKAVKISSKRECITECNDRAGKKYFTIGILYQKIRPAYALLYIIRSMRYEMRWYKIKSLIRILIRKECIDLPDNSLYYT